MYTDYPPSKRKQVDQIIHKMLLQEGYWISEHESLLGKLSNLAELAWPGRAFLFRFRCRNTQLIEEHGRKPDTFVLLPAWEAKDFNWWAHYNQSVTRSSILSMLDNTLPETQIFFNRATNGERPTWRPGIGAWFQGNYICR